MGIVSTSTYIHRYNSVYPFSFIEKSNRQSNNDGDSFVPMVISPGSNGYVVWLDNTPGNLEAFFKKGVD